MKRPVLFVLLFILVVGGIIVAIRITDAYLSESTRMETKQAEQVSDVPLGVPVFEWTYQTFTQDEIPRTTISLKARYSGGTVQKKEIDTIQGGCNAYSEPDADVYQGSEMIICYYAGLGHYYKVVESEDEYLVQRKVFEEASPEYDPPIENFQTIAQFLK